MSEHPLSEGFLPSQPGPSFGPTRPAASEPGPVLSHPRTPDSADSGALAGAESSTASGDGKKRRRRGTRGGRRRSKRPKSERAPSETGADEPAASSRSQAAGPATPTSSAPASSTKEPSSPRRRRSRRSKGSTQKAEETAKPAGEDERDKKRSRKRGSRGGRRRRSKDLPAAVEIEFIPGEEDELPELNDLPEDAVLVADEPRKGSSRRDRRSEGSRQKSSRKKTSSSRSRGTKAEPELSLEPAAKRNILVNARDPEETRVAVVENGRIVDLQMTVKKHSSYVSDIYRGRVVNLESAIGAAFVDFGQGRNGFLHASDVLSSYGDADWSLDKLLSTPTAPETDVEVDEEWDEDKAEAEPAEEKREARGKRRGRSSKGRSRRSRQPIEKLLKKGQNVVVQITKDAIGDKGPTLTTYVSIPGRYLVLMPSLERTGVSRKIDDDKERRRLKRILSSLDIPEGMGVIVRTAGIGKTKTEIRRDLEYLLLAWEDFAKRLKLGRAPAPLYQESDVAVTTMRDLFTAETESVVVDDEKVHKRMLQFTEKLMPEHLERIKLHDGPRPLFQTFGVEQDFEKIFARRVELPSGGSIVLDQTEALVAIDVNSGRTREEGADFEDIALKTNMEAVPEIARQIRLRDLGGIIVLDYIDMMRAGSRRSVERATREYLKRDRARSKIGRISQFGLLELTRQRLGPGLSKLVYDTCRACRGSGRRRNASSRAQAILRRLGASLALKGFTTVEVRSHPEVIEYLEKELSTELKELEESSGRKLVLLGVPDQVEDSVLHYLRADGREVRPGGRRKR